MKELNKNTGIVRMAQFYYLKKVLSETKYRQITQIYCGFKLGMWGHLFLFQCGIGFYNFQKDYFDFSTFFFIVFAICMGTVLYWKEQKTTQQSIQAFHDSQYEQEVNEFVTRYSHDKVQDLGFVVFNGLLLSVMVVPLFLAFWDSNIILLIAFIFSPIVALWLFEWRWSKKMRTSLLEFDSPVTSL